MTANHSSASGKDNSGDLIRMTDRLSQLMEQEVELLRDRRANDIQALQSDKESLAAVYQRVITGPTAQPDGAAGPGR